MIGRWLDGCTLSTQLQSERVRRWREGSSGKKEDDEEGLHSASCCHLIAALGAVIYLSSFDCEAMERPRSREIDDPPVELSGPAQMIAGGGAG